MGTKNKGLNRKNKRTPKKSKSSFSILKSILLSFNLIVVFYSPFVRGLYFEPEQFPAEVLVFSGFVSFWFIKCLSNDKKFICTPMEYFSLGLVLVYFISIITSVSCRLALSEWLKYCMYFSIFFMITDLVVTIKDKLLVLWTLMASSLGLCIIGIDSASGSKIVDTMNKLFEFLHIPVSFFGLYVDGRINSTVQYPNALAVYLMVAFFISVTLSVISSKRWRRVLAGICSFVFIITIVYSISRGVLLLMPFMFVLYLVVIPKQYKLKALMLSIIAGISSIASILFTLITENNTIGFIEKTGENLWVAILVGIFVSISLVIIFEYSFSWMEKLKGRLKLKPYIVLITSAVILAIMFVIFTIPKQLVLVNNDNNNGIFQKGISLVPDRNYKLVFDIYKEGNTSENLFEVKLESRSTENILFSGSTNLVYSNKNVGDKEKIEIPFNVPEDSMIVDIRLTNAAKNTRVIIDNTKIIDDNGHIVKDVIFSYRFVPDSISKRFGDLFLSKSLVQRKIFISDGFKMFKDYWFVGAGGGAWIPLNFSYQSYLYWSTQAHTYMLQVAIETGIIGLIFLVLLICSVIVQFIIEQKYKKGADDNIKILQGTLLTSILGMFVHSVADFDLSLSSVYILLWTLMALFNSGYRHERPPIDKNKEPSKLFATLINRLNRFKSINVNPVVMIVVLVLVTIMPILLGSAIHYDKLYNKSLRNGNESEALNYIKKAASLDELNADYKLKYADLILSKENITKDEYEVVSNLMNSAQKLDKYNVSTTERVAALYMKMSEVDKGLDAINKAVELRPLFEQEWYVKLNFYYQVTLAYLNNGDTVKAEKYLNTALNALNEAKVKNNSNMFPFVFSYKTQELLEKLTYIKNNFDNDDLNQINRIMFYSIADMDIDSDNVPDQWKVITPDLVATQVNNSTKFEKKFADKNGKVQTRTIRFKGGKTYKIELTLENGNDIDRVLYFVQNYHNMDYEPLVKESAGTYSAQISFPSDYSEKDDSHMLLLIDQNIVIDSLCIVEM